MVDRQTIVFHSLLNAAFYSGMHHLMSHWTQGSGVVFTLHNINPDPKKSFDPNYLLDICPHFLEKSIQIIQKAGFDFVTLDEALVRLQKSDSRKFVSFTFDDGYRSVRDLALPILRKYNVPSTIFVASSFADGLGDLWWLRLEYIIRHSNQIKISIDAVEHVFLTETDAQKRAAWQKIYWHLRGLDEPFMRAAIMQLAHDNHISVPNFSKELCMTWDELREVAQDPLVTIGAHTVSHYMLAKWPEYVVEQEIKDSVSRIESELDTTVRHLAYPVGDHTSAGTREFLIAEKLGLASAWTTRPGHLFPENLAHKMALPRLSLNGHYQEARYLEMFLSGLPVMMWNKFRKVNIY